MLMHWISHDLIVGQTSGERALEVRTAHSATQAVAKHNTSLLKNAHSATVITLRFILFFSAGCVGTCSMTVMRHAVNVIQTTAPTGCQLARSPLPRVTDIQSRGLS